MHMNLLDRLPLLTTPRFRPLPPHVVAVALLSTSLHRPRQYSSILSSFSFLSPPPNITSPEMLSSFDIHEGEEEEQHHHYPHQQHQVLLHHQNPPHQLGSSTTSFLSTSNQTSQLLMSCAELVHHSDFHAAHRVLSLLSSTASPYGDSSDRLAHQFTSALSLRLTHLSLLPNIPSDHRPLSSLPPPPPPDAATLQSSYLSLNQVTPFLRFSHLTANQAILEAVKAHRAVHILDFDTMHGVQWPPLLQAIAGSSSADPPSVRITGAGSDIDVLRRTGDRLKTFADTLDLKFQFHPLLLPINTTAAATSAVTSPFEVQEGEVLAVNCVHFLHKMLKDPADDDPSGTRAVVSFLRAVKAMSPAIVTVAEREASHNCPRFLQRFAEALGYYTAAFESLEATLPPTSRERMAVEQAWFGREIADVVAGEGEGRRERHERHGRWEGTMSAAGFSPVPLSTFAFSQARLLLRLHYPSEGYQLQMVRDSLFLGWKNRPLFSVSSWH